MVNFTDWALTSELDDEDPAAPLTDDEDPEEDEDEEDEDSEDEEEDDDESEVPQYLNDIAAQKAMIEDLRRSVGRAQSLTEQYRRGHEEVRAELTQQNETVASLLAAIVNGIDDSVIDPTLKAKVRQAQTDIAAESAKERTKAELLKELGYNPDAARAAQEMAQAQAVANDMAADLEDEITSMGLDPDEFDWEGVKAQFIEGGVQQARRWARTQIRTALTEAQTAQRRGARKSAAGPTPKSAAGTSNKNPLQSGSFAERKAALDKLLA